MTLQEARKRQREEMNPVRFRYLRFGVPVYLLTALLSVTAAILVGCLADAPKAALWALLPVGVLLVATVALIVASRVIRGRELKEEFLRWAYLFDKELEYGEETLATEDPESGIEYVLTAKGLKVFLPIAGRQVFDEVNENESLLLWDDVEIMVATDNFAHRVRLALAVIDVSQRSVDGEYIPSDAEVHFLPIDAGMAAYVRKTGLENRLSVEWRYIQKHPTDAFSQILARGYIRTLIDENGKRIKREDADGLYRE